MDYTRYCLLSDKELVILAKDGDEGAQNALLSRHQDEMVGLALNILKCKDLALEAVQDAFLQVWKCVSSFRGEAEFRTWLYRTVVNRCLEVQRRSEMIDKHLTRIKDDYTTFAYSCSQPPWVTRGDRFIETKELRERLVRAISLLEPPYKVVFIMNEFQGFSPKQIAEYLDISLSAVKTRLSRARATLRASLNDCRDDDPQQ